VIKHLYYYQFSSLTWKKPSFTCENMANFYDYDTQYDIGGEEKHAIDDREQW
jgi:hypothetical protein